MKRLCGLAAAALVVAGCGSGAATEPVAGDKPAEKLAGGEPKKGEPVRWVGGTIGPEFVKGDHSDISRIVLDVEDGKATGRVTLNGPCEGVSSNALQVFDVKGDLPAEGQVSMTGKAPEGAGRGTLELTGRVIEPGLAEVSYQAADVAVFVAKTGENAPCEPTSKDGMIAAPLTRGSSDRLGPSYVGLIDSYFPALLRVGADGRLTQMEVATDLVCSRDGRPLPEDLRFVSIASVFPSEDAPEGELRATDDYTSELFFADGKQRPVRIWHEFDGTVDGGRVEGTLRSRVAVTGGDLAGARCGVDAGGGKKPLESAPVLAVSVPEQ